GTNASGVDLGSDSVKPVRAPVVALVMGAGVSPGEIGAAWHAFDTALALPVSKLDPAQLGEIPLERYTSIVLANGNYAKVPEAAVAALKRWIAAGGSLVTYNSGARWAIGKGLLQAKLREAARS